MAYCYRVKHSRQPFESHSMIQARYPLETDSLDDSGISAQSNSDPATTSRYLNTDKGFACAHIKLDNENGFVGMLARNGGLQSVLGTCEVLNEHSIVNAWSTMKLLQI